ncbi:MAG: ATP-binding protein [Candidatus Kapabacteria bacterium]|nr:ATP-binding protein [Candidatus Kapabacteria bacterium]
MEEKEQSTLDDFSSRIKKVYIPLYGFKFFHGPSDLSDIDDRFIGRRKIIERLKAILTGGATISGAYLVSGFRGMGKTSFVAKTISEISKAHVPLKFPMKFLQLVFFTVILSIISFMLFNNYSNKLLVIIFPIYIIRIFYKINKKGNETKSPFTSSEASTIFQKSTNSNNQSEVLRKYEIELRQIGISIIGIILSIILMNTNTNTIFVFPIIYVSYILYKFRKKHLEINNLTVKTYRQKKNFKIFVLSIFNDYFQTAKHLTKNIKFSFFLVSVNYLVNFYSYSVALIWYQRQMSIISITLLLFFIYFVWKYLLKNPDNNKFSIFDSTKKFLHNVRTIYIKINLSYDNLKEIDVLKLISSGLLTKYRDWHRSFRIVFFPLVYSTVFGISFFSYFFYFNSIYRASYAIKQLSDFYFYFPSQGSFFIEDSKESCRFESINNCLESIHNRNNLPLFTSFIENSYIDYKLNTINMLLLDSNFYSLIDCGLKFVEKKIKYDSLLFEIEESQKDTTSSFQRDTLFYVRKKVAGTANKIVIDTIVCFKKSGQITPDSLFKANLLNDSIMVFNKNNFIGTHILSHTRANDSNKNTIAWIKNSSGSSIKSNSGFLKGNICREEILYLNLFSEFKINLPEKLKDNQSLKILDVNIFFKSLIYYSKLSKWQKFLMSYSSNIDFIVYNLYKRIRPIISEGLFIHIFECLNPLPIRSGIISVIHSNIIPYRIDYFGLIFIINSIIGFSLLKRINFLKFKSNFLLFRDLKRINEMIDAQISYSSGFDAGVGKNYGKFFGMKISKSKHYPQADERFIERELINFLDEMHQHPRMTFRPQFIFIFDELDKIEPAKEIDEQEITYNTRTTTLFSPERTRERQQAILQLLSNLKYFLTTAKAKFIFIAGRELYDAYLADVSDRNFYIGNIFNDVIYVDSFFNDNLINDKKERNNTDNFKYQKSKDITKMTERYVCNYLFPSWYIEQEKEQRKDGFEPNLRNYNKYIIDNFESHKLNDEDQSKEKFIQNEILRKKREKIIMTLQHFIVYLTHISNGSPKKTTIFFEKFIESKEFSESLTSFDNQFVNLDKNITSEFYLGFDYFSQYSIGMVNYLAYPIILEINNNLVEYGDKLLVSASFLIDHIFKFHKSSFSWNNIETTPELLDINKTTELRDFIGTILHFLTKTHLQRVNTGLHTYKFPRMISQEISMLSRVKEDAGAIFNFTLDESLAVKNYYDKRLRIEINSDNKRNENNQIEDTNNNIHALKMILGDIYFYEEEYQEAINFYKASVYGLRNKKVNKFESARMLTFIRNMLKLGIANEKRKNYPSALKTYSEIAQKIIEFRYIDLPELGLKEIFEDGESKVVANREKEKEVNFVKNIAPASEMDKWDNDNEKELVKKLINQLSPEKAKVISKATLFASISHVYQPFLAKLMILEKPNMGGITAHNLNTVYQEFLYLTKVFNTSEKFYIECDFWSKVGDILYFKNGSLDISKIIKSGCHEKKNLSDKKYNKSKIQCSNKCNYFCQQPNQNVFCSTCFVDTNNEETYCDKTREIIKKQGSNAPCTACFFYHKTLRILLDKFIRIRKDIKDKKGKNKPNVNSDIVGINEILYSLLNTLSEKSFEDFNVYNYRSLAINLSNIGDVFLNCLVDFKDINTNEINDQVKKELIKEINSFKDLLIALFQDEPSNSEHDNNKYKIISEKVVKNGKNIYDKSRAILLLYWLSAVFFKKSNDYKEYAHQNRKILYFIRDLVDFDNSFENNEALIKSIRSVASKVISGLYSAYQNVHRIEIEKIKGILLKESDAINDIDLRSISLVEIDEVVYIYRDLTLKMKSKVQNKLDLMKTLINEYKLNIVSPFNEMDSMFNRILSLKYKAKLNFKLLVTLISCFDDTEKSEERIYERLIYKLFKNLESKEFIFLDSAKRKSEEIVFTGREFIFHLITDSIFCLQELIKLTNLYGFTYLINHSFIAWAHEKLADWLMIYNSVKLYLDYKITIGFRGNTKIINDYNKCLKSAEVYLTNRNNELEINIQIILALIFLKGDERKYLFDFFEINKIVIVEIEKWIKENNDTSIELDIKNDLIDKLKQLCEIDDDNSLTEYYHYERAIQHYHMTIETHTEGLEYYNFIEKLYFLNDDLDDRVYHFAIATERFKINNGQIKKKINELKEIVKETRLYNPDFYTPKSSDKNEL